MTVEKALNVGKEATQMIEGRGEQVRKTYQMSIKGEATVRYWDEFSGDDDTIVAGATVCMFPKDISQNDAVRWADVARTSWQ